MSMEQNKRLTHSLFEGSERSGTWLPLMNNVLEVSRGQSRGRSLS
jgi:hypothetical protein